MNRFTATDWGLKPKLRKMFYAGVAERIILYVAFIWYNEKVVVMNLLLSMQICFLMCVTKCYVTVSRDALLVLSRVLGLVLRASWKRISRPSSDGIRVWSEPLVYLWRPTQRLEDLWSIQWISHLTPKTAYSY